jgi:hypothetical protein
MLTTEELDRQPATKGKRLPTGNQQTNQTKEAVREDAPTVRGFTKEQLKMAPNGRAYLVEQL